MLYRTEICSLRLITVSDSASHNSMNVLANTSFSGKNILRVERDREKLII